MKRWNIIKDIKIPIISYRVDIFYRKFNNKTHPHYKKVMILNFWNLLLKTLNISTSTFHRIELIFNFTVDRFGLQASTLVV